MIAVILAAGIGSRLGKPFPKCLNRLPYGESIIERQVRLLRSQNIKQIIVVVGFKKELIMEHVHNVLFKYNHVYYLTNTSKSLALALDEIDSDVIWMNGDVIFDERALKEMLVKFEQNKNLIAVINKKCSGEEVKFCLDKDGSIKKISKDLQKSEGEAVGINIIRKQDLPIMKKNLNMCSENDYFEKAIEFSIDEGIKFYPVYLNEFPCIEVDFEEDWNDACEMFNTK